VLPAARRCTLSTLGGNHVGRLQGNVLRLRRDHHRHCIRRLQAVGRGCSASRLFCRCRAVRGAWFTGCGKVQNDRRDFLSAILLVFPMFLFCGVFFPLTTLPIYLQWLAWALPLTSIVSLMRTLTLGTPLQPQVFIVIVAWLMVLVPWSRQAMSQRLIK
jgi:hypothetical protein